MFREVLVGRERDSLILEVVDGSTALIQSPSAFEYIYWSEICMTQ